MTWRKLKLAGGDHKLAQVFIRGFLHTHERTKNPGSGNEAGFLVVV
jgi:hypothetical protein